MPEMVIMHKAVIHSPGAVAHPEQGGSWVVGNRRPCHLSIRLCVANILYRTSSSLMHLPSFARPALSLHHMDKKGGELKHDEFLVLPRTDPRKGLTEKLVNEIPDNACVLVYNKVGSSDFVVHKLSYFLILNERRNHFEHKIFLIFDAVCTPLNQTNLVV